RYGTPVPGKNGFVTSPFSPNSGYIDVRGFAPGTPVKDPYTGKVFLTPWPSCIAAAPAALDRYPRGFSGHVTRSARFIRQDRRRLEIRRDSVRSRADHAEISRRQHQRKS